MSDNGAVAFDTTADLFGRESLELFGRMTDYSGQHPDGEAPDSESEKMTKKKKEWLNNLPSKNERYKEPNQLPNWVKLAIAKYELGYHDTVREAAEERGKAAGTLSDYRCTPAGRKYIERFQEVLDNPPRIAETLLRGEMAGFTLDFMEMWQTAVESNDYAEVRKMFETIMDRVPGGLSKKGSDSGSVPSIEINLIGGAESESDAEFEVIEADWDEIDED